MENSISLIDIFYTLRKRWKLIVLMTIAATAISGVISYFVITPVYQATTQILVNQKNSENQLDLSLMRSNVDLISTYSMIIKSPAILDIVTEKLNLKQSIEELNKHIAIKSQENSQVFYLVVEESDAGRAVDLANTISETFQEEIKGIMNVDNVSILAKAELKENPVPIKPNHLVNLSIAIIVGLLFGIGLAIVLESMDKSLKNSQDVEAILGLPVLGSIEYLSGKGLKKTKRISSIQQMGGESIESKA